MLQPPNNSQPDEAVWRAWLQKNRVQDRFRYERRLKVTVLAGVFVTLSALLWRFAS